MSGMDAARNGVSVLLTVRGGDTFLAGAVQTVVAQSHRPLELVLVDDGIEWKSNTPATLAEVCERNDVRLQVLEPASRGRAQSLNTALANSSCKFVAILDVDDRWHAQKLERQMSQVRHLSEPILIGSATFQVFGDEPLPQPEILAAEIMAPQDATAEVHAHCPLTHSSVLAPTDFLRQLGGYDGSRQGQFDWDLFARAVFAGARLLRIEEPLTFKRLHAAQSFEARQRLPYLWRSIVLQWNIQNRFGLPLYRRVTILRRALAWLLPARLKLPLIRARERRLANTVRKFHGNAPP